MSTGAGAADTRLRAWHRAARRRRVAIVVGFAMPWWAGLLVSGLSTGDRRVLAILAMAVAATAWCAWCALRGVDAAWLARRLDARRRDMEDSAALLFAMRDGTALQALQRDRLQRRIATAPSVELRDPWPRNALVGSALAAALALGLALAWPASGDRSASIAPASPMHATAVPEAPRLRSVRLDIRPPAYTRLASRTQTGLDATAPEASLLRWTLHFSPQPASARLRFRDGREVALRREGTAWRGSLRLARSGLYRIVLPTPLPKAQAGLHRLDAIADAPPVLRVGLPARTLSEHQAGQHHWPLRFEAEDDHGLAQEARLRVTRVQGTGENVQSRERVLVLRGSGGLHDKHWSHALDLDALGLSPGDDVIVQVQVADNRTPAAQQALSPSFILRWPLQPPTPSAGMDGLSQLRIPAYLRSQRQVIIDAEALLARKRKLPAQRFHERSVALGGDQQALRLRYGRFLGEEGEQGGGLPTNDAPTADAHDAAPPPAKAATFGEAGDVVAAFGHAHDTAEIATLLEPKTKALLRAALREMWASELGLRQGDPAAALPHAYKALASIKQVQQADRAYLARTSIEAPPIDFERRLGGVRDGLADRPDPLASADTIDAVPARAWRALQAPIEAQGPVDGHAPDAIDLDALERWVRAQDAPGLDALSVIAAIDTVRETPACGPCRASLRAAIWPLLPRPPATAGTQPRADAAGAAYLQALDAERRP